AARPVAFGKEEQHRPQPRVLLPYPHGVVVKKPFAEEKLGAQVVGFAALFEVDEGLAAGRGGPPPAVALRVQPRLEAVGGGQEKAGFVVVVIGFVQRLSLGLGGIDVG
nr:hypothetical protein [Tanacetum cinerariifolium]